MMLKNSSGTYRSEVCDYIRRALNLLNFKFEVTEDVLVGLRGGWITEDTGDGIPKIRLNFIDQVHPRCSILFLPRLEKPISLFRTYLAGTVPHIKYATESMENEGQGANCLDYGMHYHEIGLHRAGTPTGHKALVMSQKSPIRRTKNDAKFDNLDSLSFENPKDNIHAGWNKDEDHGFYASAGCQTISGYPFCRKQDGSGQWVEFMKHVEASNQKDWKYILLHGSIMNNVFKSFNDPNQTYTAPFIYGCQHDDIISLKEKLSKHYGKKINSTNVYDWDLMQLIVKFQTEKFGLAEADAIVGPKTLKMINELK